jgi:biopolymer transport protein ExbD
MATFLLLFTALYGGTAHAVCSSSHLPDWVRQLTHIENGCQHIGQALSTVRLPPATNAVEPNPRDWQSAALVVVTQKEVTFNGVFVTHIDKDGRISSEHKRGQLVVPLQEAAEAQADVTKQRARRSQRQADAFKGQVILAIDASLPFATTREVMYTMGQAQFSTFAFAVDDPSPSAFGSLKASAPSGPSPAAKRPPQLSLSITDKGITILGADHVLHPGGLPAIEDGQARPPTTPCSEGVCESVNDYSWAELKSLLVKIKNVYPTNHSMILVPSNKTSHAVLTRTIDVSRSYTVDGQSQPLFPWVVIAGGSIGEGSTAGSDAASAPKNADLPKLAASGSSTRRLAIFTSCLPSIGPPRSAGAPPPKALERPVDGGCGAMDEFLEEAEEKVPEEKADRPATGGVPSVGSDSIILGAPNKSLIDLVIKRHMNQLKYCYQRELADKPTLGGKITVKFVIVQDGSVSKATTKSSTMGNSDVESCLNQHIQRLKFPKPKGGGTVIVSYPFSFEPDGP